MISSWLSLLLSLPLGSYPTDDLEGAEWRVLTDGSTHVACSKQPEITWCRSTAVINGSKDRLTGILKDFENYPQVFKRVYKTKVLEPNVVHVLLDMPFPLKLLGLHRPVRRVTGWSRLGLYLQLSGPPRGGLAVG